MNQCNIIRELKTNHGSEGLTRAAGSGCRIQAIAFVPGVFAARLSESRLLELKAADGEVDPSFWVLLNTGNATDGTFQPEERNLGHTKGSRTRLCTHCFPVPRRKVEQKLCVFEYVGKCGFLGDCS